MADTHFIVFIYLLGVTIDVMTDNFFVDFLWYISLHLGDGHLCIIKQKKRAMRRITIVIKFFQL